MQIGVMVDSFRKGFKEGISRAKAVGAAGIQVYATSGELDPDNLSISKRAEIKDMIISSGLMISAVCGDLGGHGFAVKADNPQKVEKTKRIIDLAKELGADVITTHIGVVPEDTGHPRFSVLAEAMQACGEYAEKNGAMLAIETGPEKCTTLRKFIESLSTKGVGVNFDPANLVMVVGDDPVKGVATLGKLIVHTHAKDGTMFQKSDPERIYDSFAIGNTEGINYEDYFMETPLGEGAVDFPAYIKALAQIGFDGFLTIEREVGDDPEKDIKLAVDFLRRLI